MSVTAAAQVKQKSDSVREKTKWTAIRVGADIINPIKTFASTDFSGWEVNADFELNNYYPVVEIGSWSRDVSLENGQYTNSGNYWRVGVDVNVLKKDPVKNMFFFGIRYGRSAYDEKLNYTIITNEFDPEDQELENRGLASGWAELVTGLRVKVAGGFWMGYTGRLKFAPGIQESQRLQTYDIPGYGLTFKQPWWGFNYYLMWKFNFKKGTQE
jgi:hypothetical protein